MASKLVFSFDRDLTSEVINLGNNILFGMGFSTLELSMDGHKVIGWHASKEVLPIEELINRNGVKHGKAAMSNSLVTANALSLAMLKLSSYLDNWGTNLPRESHNTWCPPLLDWIKINVDASLLNSNRAGIWGIFRDYKDLNNQPVWKAIEAVMKLTREVLVTQSEENIEDPYSENNQFQNNMNNSVKDNKILEASSLPPKPLPKQSTKTKVFHLDSLIRHEEEMNKMREERERMEREEAERRIFITQPIMNEKRKCLTDVHEFVLHVDHRAMERSEFGKKISYEEDLTRRSGSLSTLEESEQLKEDYIWVSTCKSEKDIWDRLCITYEGTNEEPGHIKTECPKLKATPSKEKVEEEPIVKKSKMKFQRALWADSASDSSETEKEEEVTSLF
ncbi:hypothetical protein KFK09_026430 [Dendrobium nobile]|uniref:Uncharacterized protein n=1 Tax=Dendrobium nobile TaxID=94219 RepID=A0A8T3A845_DENNO|nr:hypothetical protein KFK09_026430 [Dendrobium nobile]